MKKTKTPAQQPAGVQLRGFPAGELPKVLSVKEVHPARAHFGVALRPFHPLEPVRRTGYGQTAGEYNASNPIVVESNFFNNATKSTHFDLRVELKTLRPRVGLKTLKGQKADLLEQLKTLRGRLNTMIVLGERELAQSKKSKKVAAKQEPKRESPALGYARAYFKSLDEQQAKKVSRALKAKERRDAKKVK